MKQAREEEAKVREAGLGEARLKEAMFGRGKFGERKVRRGEIGGARSPSQPEDTFCPAALAPHPCPSQHIQVTLAAFAPRLCPPSLIM